MEGEAGQGGDGAGVRDHGIKRRRIAVHRGGKHIGAGGQPKLGYGHPAETILQLGRGPPGHHGACQKAPGSIEQAYGMVAQQAIPELIPEPELLGFSRLLQDETEAKGSPEGGLPPGHDRLRQNPRLHHECASNRGLKDERCAQGCGQNGGGTGGVTHDGSKHGEWSGGTGGQG
ncbi:MAG: hypothetical protein ACK56I_29395, partial [bacterium]